VTDIVEVADGQLIEPPLTVEQRLAEHCAYAEKDFTNGDYFHLLAKDAAALIASQARRIEELEKGGEADQLRETGWVIERGDSQPSTPTYWAGPDRWSQDHMDAVRFTRQIDAARVASRETWLAPHRVCEHVWISARSLLNRTGEG
jgi:hypothetical protein